MFWLSIVTTEAPVFLEEVVSVIVPGSQGYFEILTGHASFVTPMGEGLLTITRRDNSKLRLFLAGGFLENSIKPKHKDKTCLILAETLRFADRTSYDSIRKVRDQLEVRIREGGISGAEFKHVRDSLVSAERLLRVAGKEFNDGKK